MTHITGVDREQTMLLPETLEDYIAADHPVRLIDAFVDGLNLSQCGFARTEPAATGRPPYAPGDLLTCGDTLTRPVPAADWRASASAIWKCSGSCASCSPTSRRLPIFAKTMPKLSRWFSGS